MTLERVSGSDAEMSFPFPEFFINPSRICLFDLLLERFDKRLLVHILSENQGDRRKTAEYLEMEYLDLCAELEKHQLIVPQPAAAEGTSSFDLSEPARHFRTLLPVLMNMNPARATSVALFKVAFLFPQIHVLRFRWLPAYSLSG